MMKCGQRVCVVLDDKTSMIDGFFFLSNRNMYFFVIYLNIKTYFYIIIIVLHVICLLSILLTFPCYCVALLTTFYFLKNNFIEV